MGYEITDYITGLVRQFGPITVLFVLTALAHWYWAYAVRAYDKHFGKYEYPNKYYEWGVCVRALRYPELELKTIQLLEDAEYWRHKREQDARKAQYTALRGEREQAGK